MKILLFSPILEVGSITLPKKKAFYVKVFFSRTTISHYVSHVFLYVIKDTMLVMCFCMLLDKK